MIIIYLVFVLQDWDFPHFVCDLDIKLPGMHAASFKFDLFQKYVNLPDVSIHVTGKFKLSYFGNSCIEFANISKRQCNIFEFGYYGTDRKLKHNFSNLNTSKYFAYEDRRLECLITNETLFLFLSFFFPSVSSFVSGINSSCCCF